MYTALHEVGNLSFFFLFFFLISLREKCALPGVLSCSLAGEQHVHVSVSESA